MRKTTKEDERRLIVTTKCNYDKPLSDITNLSGLNISVTTATRRLKEVNLISRYKRRKPFLKLKHKKAQLEWAQNYKDWTVEDWKKVIFSDKCLMRVGVDLHRQCVIRPTGAALEECYLLPTFKSGRVTIMIWACFSGERNGPILVLKQGGISSDEYEEILYEGLLSMVEDILKAPQDFDTITVADENTFLFMHDNAPYHKTAAIMELLRENNIPVMIWPAQSPDLNPIENLWHDLKYHFYLKFRALYSSPSSSQDAFEKYRALIQECWAEQNQELIQSLIQFMPKCCQAVIDAKGSHIKY